MTINALRRNEFSDVLRDYGKDLKQLEEFYPTGSRNSGVVNGDYYTSSEVEANNYALDDGKIGFKRAAGNFLKGLVKPITSMFESPGNFLKGALMIGGCAALCAITGGAAAPFLVAGGLAMGGIQFAKGAAGAMTATTDAEAEAAWQDMGTGTFLVGTSLLGAKKAAGAAEKAEVVEFKGSSEWGTFKSAGKCLNPKNLWGAGKKGFEIAGENITGWWTGTKAKTANPTKPTDPDGTDPNGTKSNKGGKAYNKNTENSPQAEIYKEVDKITTEEYQAKVQGQQTEKLNNKISQADPEAIRARAAKAKTPTARKELLKQAEMIEKQQAQVNGTSANQPAASVNQPAASVNSNPTANLSPKELKTFNKVTKMSKTEVMNHLDSYGDTMSPELIDAIETKMEITKGSSVNKLVETPKTTKPVETPKTNNPFGSEEVKIYNENNASSPQASIYEEIDKINANNNSSGQGNRPSRIDWFNKKYAA